MQATVGITSRSQVSLVASFLVILQKHVRNTVRNGEFPFSFWTNQIAFLHLYLKEKQPHLRVKTTPLHTVLLLIKCGALSSEILHNFRNHRAPLSELHLRVQSKQTKTLRSLSTWSTRFLKH